jgi:hypothetical protein
MKNDAYSSDEYKKDIMSQLEEAFGQLLYTYTSNLKQAYIYDCTYKVLKATKIILSSLATVGFIGLISNNESTAIIIGSFISAILLALNLYFKDSEIIVNATIHIKISDELWVVRESYKSLMTDLPYISIEELKNGRDKLIKETDTIYKKSRKTGKLAYYITQKSLKYKEEQTFSDDEVNTFLPKHLRIKK